jgi:hypothetical protein
VYSGKILNEMHGVTVQNIQLVSATVMVTANPIISYIVIVVFSFSLYGFVLLV